MLVPSGERAPTAPRRRPPPAALAAGAAALLALAAGGWWLGARGGSEAVVPPPPSPPPASSPAAAAPASGTLVIDALPWGEVTEVVDAGGTRRAVSGVPDTPLALELPPGAYTVRVRNPGFADTISLTATVRPAEVERRLLEFRRVDASDYFRRTGS